jgi:hypothetical protein
VPVLKAFVLQQFVYYNFERLQAFAKCLDSEYQEQTFVIVPKASLIEMKTNGNADSIQFSHKNNKKITILSLFLHFFDGIHCFHVDLKKNMKILTF